MFGWLKRKSVLTLDQLAELSGFLQYGTAAGAAVNPNSAVDVTAVFCAVRVLSEGLAQVPVRLIKETQDSAGRTTRTIERGHWAHRLMAVKPNDWQTPFEFREYAAFCAVLGDGFLGIKNTVGGEVREILPVPIGSWRVEQLPDWSLRFAVTLADKTQRYFTQDQVFYFRGPTFDGYRGLNAVRKAREAIGLSSVLEKQQARLAGNGGKPSGVLSFAEPLSPDSKEKLREAWQEKYGPNGAGGVAILDGSAKFESMTMTSVDAQHVETRKHQIEEIARAFRVHPIMLMHSNTTTTFASAEQHFRNHVVHSLGPWMVRFEQVCHRDILNRDPQLRIDLDERGLMRGDFKDQADYYTKALGAGGQPGWLTVNEIRSERDMNPIGDAWADTVPRGAMGMAANAE